MYGSMGRNDTYQYQISSELALYITPNLFGNILILNMELEKDFDKYCTIDFYWMHNILCYDKAILSMTMLIFIMFQM